MPNSTSASSPPLKHESGTPANFDQLRTRADHLFRTAAECCRQHERYAHLSERDMEEVELNGAFEQVCLCDRLLSEAAAAYEKAAARVHPDGDDEDWWRKANALWMASREYDRRHAGCDHAGRRLTSRRSAGKFGELQMEYELAASALLSLKQAVDAYRKARPEAVERPTWRT
jgi:hypothetical protein